MSAGGALQDPRRYARPASLRMGAPTLGSSSSAWTKGDGRALPLRAYCSNNVAALCLLVAWQQPKSSRGAAAQIACRRHAKRKGKD